LFELAPLGVTSSNAGGVRHLQSAVQIGRQPDPNVVRRLRTGSVIVPVSLVGRGGLELAIVQLADLVEEFELGLEEVDVPLLVLQQLLEYFHGDIVLGRLAGLAAMNV